MGTVLWIVACVVCGGAGFGVGYLKGRKVGNKDFLDKKIDEGAAAVKKNTRAF